MIVTFLLVALVGVPFAFFEGWLFMLLMGALHLNILPAVIPAGYWPCFWISVIATTLFSTVITENRMSHEIASD